jgi:hypothetical protein
MMRDDAMMTTDANTAGLTSILPRRIIGPDNIKFLRDVSKQLTGHSFALDNCRVQRNSFGGPSINIDVAKLEKVGRGHPESYGVFIRNVILPQAHTIEEKLAGAPAQTVKRTLSWLLKKAHREDSTAWWVLSAPMLRRRLFPGAYRECRSDSVFYLHRPNDFHFGKVVRIGGLHPSSIASFTSFAQRMINQQVDAAIITPTH